jgi:hypothetical protein
MGYIKPMKDIVLIGVSSLSDFKRVADDASRCGATHLVVTHGLPAATWQLDRPDDPYPTWYSIQPGLLKIFCPERIRPFMNADYAQRVAQILEERCEILRSNGLRGVYLTTEPQVIPESVFEANPSWRGPRVDHPYRSRVARFAPCVSNADVGKLYREAISALVSRCPEIDTLLMMTIDSGSGFCWAPALYPGPNGCSNCCAADLGERAINFLLLLQDAARREGSDLEIDLSEIPPRAWMAKAFSDPVNLAKRLPVGLSINNHEGPDGAYIRPFSQFGNLFYSAFYPVIGIPRPVELIRQQIRDGLSGGKRRLSNLDDGTHADLMFSILRTLRTDQPKTELEGLNLLGRVAQEAFGVTRADAMVEAWMALDDAEKQLASLDFGPFLLMGGLLSRWITRPLVPCPEALEEEELELFLPHLFQARDLDSALNIIDIQAMRMYEGWSGRLLVEQVVTVTDGHLSRATQAAGRTDDKPLLNRISLLRCLLQNAKHAVSYQAQLDRLKMDDVTESQASPPLGWTGRWENLDLARIARAEIENTLAIIRIISDSEEDIIDQAQRDGEESPLLLGKNLLDQLRQKIVIMNKQWTQYNRNAGGPNP